MTRIATLLVALLLGTSVAARPAAAQTFPTDDAVLRRIWTIGMDSSHTEDFAATLFDSLGPRLTGSPNVRAAQDWLVKTYASFGIEAKNERYGTWRSWRRGPSHIDLISPRVRTLEATMVGFSPGTRGRDLVARVVILPHFADSTEFVKWLPKAKGKLVLVSAPSPSCRPTDEFAQFATPATKERLDSARAALQADWGNRFNVRGTGYSLALGGGELGVRLEKGGAAGLLTSRPKNAWGTREIFETYNTRAPVVSLSCEDYGLVFRLAERNRNPRLRLNLESQFLGEKPVFNTIATIPGTEKPNEFILLSAHFDSWDGSSGATDNGTGSITMLEAMRILKQAYPHPKRTIRVGHWTGEEMGLVGSKAYREDHPEVVAGLQAIFNNDNGTGRIVRIGATGFPNGDVHMRQWLEKIPTEFRTQINYIGIGVPGTGGSDDFSFYCAGTPSFGLGGSSWDYGNYTWHTDRDTYDKVVFDDLKSNATLAAMLVYLASEDPEKISRERTDLAVVADSVLRARAAAAAATTGTATSTSTSTAGTATLPPPLTAWPSCGTAPRKTLPRLK